VELKPGYKQIEVGVVPDSWKEMALADVCWFQEGPGVRTHQFTVVGVKLLNGTNITNGRIDLDTTTRYISNDEAYGAYRHFLVNEGDILLATSGITIEKLNEKVAFVGADSLPLCMNTSTVRFRPLKGRLLDRYLYFFLQSDSFRDQIGRQATGSAQLNFGPSHLNRVTIPIPQDIREQMAIAAALNDVDALITALDQLIAKKRDLKQAAMQQLLTGQLRLPGFHGEWEVRKLADIAPLQRGFDLPNSALHQGRYPVVYSNGVLNRHSVYMAKAPGVVTGRSGTIGKVTYVEEDYWPHNTSLWVTNFKDNFPKFIYYLYVNIRLERFGTGSGVPTLNRNDVHAYQVAIPSTRKEQIAIAAVLSDMDAELEALEQRRDKTRSLKQGMMQELLTGRTRLV
jgi:type I restriction enzyme, S subunit